MDVCGPDVCLQFRSVWSHHSLLPSSLLSLSWDSPEMCVSTCFNTHSHTSLFTIDAHTPAERFQSSWHIRWPLLPYLMSPSSGPRSSLPALLPPARAASFVMSLLKLTPHSFLEALEFTAGKKGCLLAATRDMIVHPHEGSAHDFSGAQETGSASKETEPSQWVQHTSLPASPTRTVPIQEGGPTPN